MSMLLTDTYPHTIEVGSPSCQMVSPYFQLVHTAKNPINSIVPVQPSKYHLKSAQALKDDSLLVEASPMTATRTTTSRGYRIALSIPQDANKRTEVGRVGILDRIVNETPIMSPSSDQSLQIVEREFSSNEKNGTTKVRASELKDRSRENSVGDSTGSSRLHPLNDQLDNLDNTGLAKKRKISPTNSARRLKATKVQTKFVFTKGSNTSLTPVSEKTKEEKNGDQSSSFQGDTISASAYLQGPKAFITESDTRSDGCHRVNLAEGQLER